MIDFKNFKTEAEALAYIKGLPEAGCETTAEAKKYLRAHLPKESYYQDKIIKRIRALFPEAFVWKAAAGAYTRQGIPDICAVINGRFYGFEVKRPFVGVLSRIQAKTLADIRAAGGRAYVITYAADLEGLLKEELDAK